MKKTKILFGIFIMAATLSCKKSQTAVNSTTVSITVTDGITGNAAVSATVYLYDSQSAVTSSTPKYTATTDQTGKASITVAYISQYYVIAEKGSEMNYFDGLIPTGIFTSTADIQDSPAQTPPAVIGGVKFRDTNGDGVINAQDYITAPVVNITANTTNTFSTTVY